MNYTARQSLYNPSTKVSGYPLFLEPSPNIQTRNPETKTVMQIALKRFEQNLQGAKLDQQEEHDN
jgi:hypothetical protein